MTQTGIKNFVTCLWKHQRSPFANWHQDTATRNARAFASERNSRTILQLNWTHCSHSAQGIYCLGDMGPNLPKRLILLIVRHDECAETITSEFRDGLITAENSATPESTHCSWRKRTLLLHSYNHHPTTRLLYFISMDNFELSVLHRT